jgi:hypothetical protein
MAVREFTDSKGVTWRVWNTRPSMSLFYGEELRNGWLTFESATERRRLAPIPGGWEDVSADRLELMCRAASEVSSRSGSASDWADTSTDRE